MAWPREGTCGSCSWPKSGSSSHLSGPISLPDGRTTPGAVQWCSTSPAPLWILVPPRASRAGHCDQCSPLGCVIPDMAGRLECRRHRSPSLRGASRRRGLQLGEPVLLRVPRLVGAANATPTPARESPSIDVFVCTYDEPLAVVEPTLIGCRAMTGNFTTYLLDDGRRQEMAEVAARLGAVYVTRPDNATPRPATSTTHSRSPAAT